MVADGGCMRCFECVGACPRRVLAYRFGPPTRPAPGQASSAPPSFSWPEEAALLGLFAVRFAALDGLYDAVPLLLALSLSVVFAYVVVLAHRLWRRPSEAAREFAEAGRLAPELARLLPRDLGS